jgi:hypothetical protein
MPSSPSPLLKLELQASGEHPDTWGDNLNATKVMIENAIAKRADIPTTGGTTTLSDTEYADNQARCSALDFSGSLASNAIIIVPNRSKSWIVRNQCTGGFTLTVKTSAGSGVVVSQGQTVTLWCDGTNVTSVSGDAATLGGVASASFARRDAYNSFTSGESHTFHALTDGATVTIDAAIGVNFNLSIGGNRTVALSNPTDGSEVVLFVTQDGTGGRTLTWPGNVLNSAALGLSTAANATDKITLVYHAAITSWYATINRGITAGGASTIADITIAGGNTDVDAFALAGSPVAPATFTFTVDTGAIIGASSPGSPALDITGFAAGSVISIINRGYILGRGGRGGRGASAGDVASANFYNDGTAGTNGGTALRLPATACTINITNANGFIWGGGGGGGGGGATHAGDGSNVGVSGGGGGGGNGGGIPGDGGSIVSANGSPGTAGGIGRLGAAGTGGAGADTGGTGVGAAGGAGGDYGANGVAGVTAAGETYTGAPGAAGTAGKAIDYNGGSTPTYISGSGSPNIKGITS